MRLRGAGHHRSRGRPAPRGFHPLPRGLLLAGDRRPRCRGPASAPRTRLGRRPVERCRRLARALGQHLDRDATERQHKEGCPVRVGHADRGAARLLDQAPPNRARHLARERYSGESSPSQASAGGVVGRARSHTDAIVHQERSHCQCDFGPSGGSVMRGGGPSVLGPMSHCARPRGERSWLHGRSEV
jgi:hypothetical protein